MRKATDGGGFFMVPRSLGQCVREKRLTPAEYGVIVVLFQEARYMPGTVMFRGKEYALSRNQLAHNEETVAKLSGTSRKVVRNALKKATELGFISRRAVCKAPKAPRITTMWNCRQQKGLSELGHGKVHAEGHAESITKVQGHSVIEESLQGKGQAKDQAMGLYRREGEEEGREKVNNSLTAATFVANSKANPKAKAGREDDLENEISSEIGRNFVRENPDELRDLAGIWRAHPGAANSNKTWGQLERILYKGGPSARQIIEIALRDWYTFSGLVQACHGVADECPGKPFTYFPDKPSAGFILKYLSTASVVAGTLAKAPLQLSETELFRRWDRGDEEAWAEILRREAADQAPPPLPDSPQPTQEGGACNQLQNPGPPGFAGLPAASPNREQRL